MYNFTKKNKIMQNWDNNGQKWTHTGQKRLKWTNTNKSSNKYAQFGLA